MEIRRIGSLNVTIVGLGCNNFGMRLDYARTEAVVHAALDAGVTLFDTADVYGGTRSEEFLARALAGRRQDVVIATKFGTRIDDDRQGAKAGYGLQAVEESLRRLNTDRIDLYQLHQPDSTTPIAETLAALNDLVRAGKVREIGCSNFSAIQLREAQEVVAPGAVHFVSLQNEYSLLHREPERWVLPECERLGVAFIPYLPLASGLLTGKYTRGAPPPEGSRLSQGSGTARSLTDERLALVDALRHLAESCGHSVLELAVSWLAHHRTVASIIAGATTPEQVRANVHAAESWQLSDSELADIDRIVPLQS